MIPKCRPNKKVDKSGLAIPVVERIRSKTHLALVAGNLCVVPGYGRRLVQVHHLLSGPEPKARSEKAGDNWTVPLCVRHHDELHHNGDERAWAESYGFDIVATAAGFWRRSPANR